MEQLPPTMKRGFTLLEVLIFTAVFSGMALVLLTILVVVTRVQVREGAVAEVNQQSNFLLRTIQTSVENSSLIELDQDAATSTLKLRMASSSADPTYIYLSGGVVYAKETIAGTPQAITSNKVTVDTLQFTKHAHPGASDEVSVSLSVSYNTTGVQQRLTQALLVGVRRVSAAVFDSNVIPSASNTYKLGASAGDWQSINSTIYFSGSNSGFGIATPTQRIELDGGVRFNPSGVKPTCDATTRGTLWFTNSGGGSDDLLEVCMRNASSSYGWSRTN